MRLNQPWASADPPQGTRNYEGGYAYSVSPEMELYLLTCSSLFGEDTFYEPADTRAQRLRDLLDRVDPGFALRLAVYAREQMKLRTTPQVILAEVADRYPRPRGGGASAPSLVRQLTPRIVRRADEPAEVLAYWLARHGGKKGLPNALKRGLADAMRHFDPYEVAKYYRRNHKKFSVVSKDVLALVHPRPRDAEQAQIFRQVLKGSVPPAETWEHALSAQSNRPEVWDAIAPRMGLLALIRNLRNLLGYRRAPDGTYAPTQAPARKALAVAIAALRNGERVRRSGILPVQLLAAWQVARSHGADPDLMAALEDALRASVETLPELPGKTVVLMDASGSMDGRLSRRSRMTIRDAASALAALLYLKTGASVMAFADTTAWVDLDGRGPATAADVLAACNVGGATYAYKAMRRLVDERVEADRVVIVSDEQAYAEWRSYWGPLLNPKQTLVYWWHRYRQRVSPRAHLYSLSVAGYPTVQFAENDPSVTILAGWSERVLDLLASVEQREAIVPRLKAAVA